jgi:hypothetical protein
MAVRTAPLKAAKPVKSKVMTITPDLAGEWLNRNTHNRPIRNRHVDTLVGVIQRGEWKMNGDPIRFAADGTLLDGQHRLWAIHLAEKPVESLVVEGLPEDTQITIDLGQKRNLGDQLRLMGESNVATMAAAINIVWQMEYGDIRSTRKPSIQQALTMFNKDKDTFRMATKKAGAWTRRLPGSKAAVAACLFQFYKRDADAAEAFLDGVVGGVGLRKDSPMLALRRHMETNKTSTLMMLALIIKAWNYYLEGKSIERLMWRPVGKQAEDFPAIMGG